MIQAASASTFTAVLQAAPGQAPTFRIVRPDGTVIIDAAGETPIEAPAGTYTVALPAPEDPGNYLVLMAVADGVTAERLEVTDSEPAVTAPLGGTYMAVLNGETAGRSAQITATILDPATNTTVGAPATVNEPSPTTYVATGTAPTAPGDYQLVWTTPDGRTTQRLKVAAPFTPTLWQVATLLRARTKDNVGNELGTFTDSTRPTAVQAQELIDTATGDIITEVGLNLPEKVWAQARKLVTIRAAMLIELSYWPEQIRQGKSAYPEYEKRYDKELPALARSAEDVSSDPSRDPGVVGDSQMPVFAFPYRLDPQDSFDSRRW